MKVLSKIIEKAVMQCLENIEVVKIILDLIDQISNSLLQVQWVEILRQFKVEGSNRK